MKKPKIQINRNNKPQKVYSERTICRRKTRIARSFVNSWSWIMFLAIFSECRLSVIVKAAKTKRNKIQNRVRKNEKKICSNQPKSSRKCTKTPFHIMKYILNETQWNEKDKLHRRTWKKNCSRNSLSRKIGSM